MQILREESGGEEKPSPEARGNRRRVANVGPLIMQGSTAVSPAVDNISGKKLRDRESFLFVGAMHWTLQIDISVRQCREWFFIDRHSGIIQFVSRSETTSIFA